MTSSAPRAPTATATEVATCDARDEPLPRGVTRKEASDPTSPYSLTRIALELPLITATQRIPPPPPQPLPLPPFLLHCTLFASYDIVKPHPAPFRHSGCPATHSRGHTSATSKNKVSQSVSKLRKRLGVQIPLPYLGGPGFIPIRASEGERDTFAYLPHPQPRNGAEMAARSGNVSRYRKVSLFQAQAREMTGIVSRPLVERVVSAIYAGQGIYDRAALFPAHAVLRYSNEAVHADHNALQQANSKSGISDQNPGWLSKLKAKAKGDKSVAPAPASASKTSEHTATQPMVRGDAPTSEDVKGATIPSIRSVKVSMVFATLDLLAPPPRLLESGGPYPIEMNKASDADLSTSAKALSEFDRGTDEDRFSKFLFAPSAADDQLFGDMLRALERRGAVWVEAGRLITPSSRNPNPRERARFLVKGVFPERFVYRCKHYRAKKFEPMPSDLEAKEIKKFGSPLVVHLVCERTGKEGIDMRDYLSPHTENAGSDPARASDPSERDAHSTAPAANHDDEGGEDEEAQLDWEWIDDQSPAYISTGAHVSAAEPVGAPPPDYTSTQKETLLGYGIESPRARALIDAEADFFRGWSIGVTEEPFKNGGWMESLGTGSSLWFAAS